MDKLNSFFDLINFLVFCFGGLALLGDKSSHTKILIGRDIVKNYIKSSVHDPFTFMIHSWLMFLAGSLCFVVIIFGWTGYYFGHISMNQSILLSVVTGVTCIFSINSGFKFNSIYKELMDKHKTGNLGNALSLHAIIFFIVSSHIDLL